MWKCNLRRMFTLVRKYPLTGQKHYYDVSYRSVSEDNSCCKNKNKSWLCSNNSPCDSTPALVCENTQTWHLLTSPALSSFCKILIKNKTQLLSWQMQTSTTMCKCKGMIRLFIVHIAYPDAHYTFIVGVNKVIVHSPSVSFAVSQRLCMHKCKHRHWSKKSARDTWIIFCFVIM